MLLTAGAQQVQTPQKPRPNLGPQPELRFSPERQSCPLKPEDSMMDIVGGSWSSN